jgi:hypothetical protein
MRAFVDTVAWVHLAWFSYADRRLSAAALKTGR